MQVELKKEDIVKIQKKVGKLTGYFSMPYSEILSLLAKTKEGFHIESQYEISFVEERDSSYKYLGHYIKKEDLQRVKLNLFLLSDKMNAVFNSNSHSHVIGIEPKYMFEVEEYDALMKSVNDYQEICNMVGKK